MDFEGKLTAAEIEKRTGVSHDTLIRLKQLGVVPYPEIKGLGKNRGIVGLYPPEVESILRWVMRERKHGLSLVEIAKKLREEHALSSEDIIPKKGELVFSEKSSEITSFVHAHVDLDLDNWVEKHRPGCILDEATIKPYGRGRLQITKIKVKPKGS